MCRREAYAAAPPTVLVTGSNRGIGLELCKALARKGYTVVAACRRSSPELDALGVRVATDIDVTSDAAALAWGRRLARRAFFDPDEVRAAVEAQGVEVEYPAHTAERQALLMPVALYVLTLVREQSAAALDGHS